MVPVRTAWPLQVLRVVMHLRHHLLLEDVDRDRAFHTLVELSLVLGIDLLRYLLLVRLGSNLRVLLDQLLVLVPVTHSLVETALRIVCKQVVFHELWDHLILDVLQRLVLLQDQLHLLLQLKVFLLLVLMLNY